MNHASRPSILAADAAGIDRACAILRDGGLVAVPTETVYGLAARADSEAAVNRIYRAKGRPGFNPLIVHVPDMDAVAAIGEVDERARRLAGAFWPGALTMVLPLRPDARIAPSVTAGLSTVALRMPAHPVMRALLSSCALPLAAPSANRSGAVSPTTTAHVAASLGGKVDAILDGGACPVGLESTIVALRRDGAWQVLRPGPVSEAQLARVLGSEAAGDGGAGAIEAPGQLASHYAPGKPVRLDATAPRGDEFMIGFGAIEGDLNLSPDGDLSQAAAGLYAALHSAARSDRAAIAVAPIPDEGVGRAIRDRLRRAAA